uniref:Uncharacterized protein n=1 Tax=Anguilla anguilla TaxID=7936 RepID=A0A0E9VWK7_ANGAN
MSLCVNWKWHETCEPCSTVKKHCSKLMLKFLGNLVLRPS